MLYYGKMDANGNLLPPELQDHKQAYQRFKKSASKGWEWSQEQLGQMYEKGEGVAKDLKKASYWYTKAADKGLPFAQQKLQELGR